MTMVGMLVVMATLNPHPETPQWKAAAASQHLLSFIFIFICDSLTRDPLGTGKSFSGVVMQGYFREYVRQKRNTRPSSLDIPTRYSAGEYPQRLFFRAFLIARSFKP